MLGRSRGGLMTLAWAVENADKVGGFAGIYPVCNLVSYPGVAKAAGAYELTAEELQTELARSQSGGSCQRARPRRRADVCHPWRRGHRRATEGELGPAEGTIRRARREPCS